MRTFKVGLFGRALGQRRSIGKASLWEAAMGKLRGSKAAVDAGPDAVESRE